MWHVENTINWLGKPLIKAKIRRKNNPGTRYEGRQWISTFYNVSAMYVTIPPRLRSGIDQLGETKELCWRWLHLSQHSHLPLETLCSFHGSCVLHHCIITTAANLASIISLLRLKSCNCICHNIYSSHPGSQNTSTVGDLLSSSRSPAAEHNRWTVKTLRMGEVRVGAFIPLYQHKLFLLFRISCGEARRWEIKVFALKLNLSQSWHPSDSWSTLKVRNKQDQLSSRQWKWK